MKAAMFMGCAMLALSAGLASAQTAAPADNDTAIAEIVVTAQKRAENLQDVPVSVTALTSDTLAARGVNNVLALNNMAPGLRISANDAAANPKIYIRGVGLSDFNPNASSGVGVYVDGVYIGSPLAQMAGFFDLAQVEVLRGPQGTLYGRNTNGGAINITTKRPTQTFTFDTSMEYGTFNAITGRGGGRRSDHRRQAGLPRRGPGGQGRRLHLQPGDRQRPQRRRPLGGPPVAALHADRRFRDAGPGQPLREPRRRHPAATPRPVPRHGRRDRTRRPVRANAYASGQCTDLLGYADTDGNSRAIDSNLEGKDKVDLFGASATRPPGRSAASRWSRSRPGSGRIATTSRIPTAARCRCWRSTIARASSSSPRSCACSPTTARPR
jgi:iron complex outermembrane receptor protein